jgi:hypothetical protein
MSEKEEMPKENVMKAANAHVDRKDGAVYLEGSFGHDGSRPPSTASGAGKQLHLS